MASTQTTLSRATRSARVGLRATREQEALLRRAAHIARQSLTGFILFSDFPMSETPQRLAKQARWQRSCAALSWPEKVRLAESLRGAIASLRKTRAEAPRTVPQEAAASDRTS